MGKKTAERLIIEMKDRLKKRFSSAHDLLSPEISTPQVEVERMDSRLEAESALAALGYKPAQATKAVEQVYKQLGAQASSEDLIRHALKSMIS
ncbi:Holliday junction ATP-dependent DNA helicase RuvA [Nitrincola nitratireducens]|uniref:Holliday junction ATP-dependent DNA helicase RuvA n=1 Tax=Nitrincola nitratireducens TaxID=1229521 RepID=W9VLR4_9GAMM|nr:Holliday junction ATP-dependent DNA helicase RuvA [Nitrincola nitratireducens]